MEKFNNIPNNKQETWITYRESKDFKDGVSALENVNSVNYQTKILILAVALNLKKASEFKVDSSRTDINEVQTLLSKLGLFFTVNTEANERINAFLSHMSNAVTHEDIHFMIAATPKDLHEAMVHAQPIPDDHESFGQAMEFPKSSIKAWNSYIDSNDESFLLSQDDPRLSDEEKAFLFFRLSANNWEQEIILVEQIIAGVKLYSPEIYSQVMTNYNKYTKL
jgi:hypothetical protein